MQQFRRAIIMFVLYLTKLSTLLIVYKELVRWCCSAETPTQRKRSMYGKLQINIVQNWWIKKKLWEKGKQFMQFTAKT